MLIWPTVDQEPILTCQNKYKTALNKEHIHLRSSRLLQTSSPILLPESSTVGLRVKVGGKVWPGDLTHS